MTGKAKPKKHTAKEIAAKVDAATTNRGGGKAGQADRSGLDKGGHAKLECPLCKITAPDLKSMQIHHEARHPKVPFDEAKLSNLHASSVPESSKPRPGRRTGGDVGGPSAVECSGVVNAEDGRCIYLSKDGLRPLPLPRGCPVHESGKELDMVPTWKWMLISCVKAWTSCMSMSREVFLSISGCRHSPCS
ncbi:hypothetical protein CK203_022510 [Vitis vinifera]|uniref:Uncharacterized protein n=1 Tax=Vitis vinifera TaxID=29760 RepID=A0A438JE39_VITVI|nr:hypothetical protein CK203_022510 [Vitis vinifera]